MEKKSYRREIKQRALQKASRSYDTKADIVKTMLGVLLATLVIIILVIFGIVRDIRGIPVILWGLAGFNIVAIIATVLSVPILAYLDRWNIAEEIYNEQEQDTENLQKEMDRKIAEKDEIISE